MQKVDKASIGVTAWVMVVYPGRNLLGINGIKFGYNIGKGQS